MTAGWTASYLAVLVAYRFHIFHLASFKYSDMSPGIWVIEWDYQEWPIAHDTQPHKATIQAKLLLALGERRTVVETLERVQRN